MIATLASLAPPFIPWLDPDLIDMRLAADPKKERPIDDPVGEPRQPAGEDAGRPRPANDPDVVPPQGGEDERRPRPQPPI